MMRNFQHRGSKPRAERFGEFSLDGLFDISAKEKRGAAITDAQHHGVVVLRRIRLNEAGRRHTSNRTAIDILNEAASDFSQQSFFWFGSK